MVQSIANMIGGFFNWRTSLSNNQAINEVIDDKKDCELACKYASKAFELIDDNVIFRNKTTKTRFKYFEKKFNEHK